MTVGGRCVSIEINQTGIRDFVPVHMANMSLSYNLLLKWKNITCFISTLRKITLQRKRRRHIILLFVHILEMK